MHVDLHLPRAVLPQLEAALMDSRRAQACSEEWPGVTTDFLLPILPVLLFVQTFLSEAGVLLTRQHQQ